MERFIALMNRQQDELLLRLAEHIGLTLLSTALAALLGIGLAVTAFYFRPIRVPLMAVINIIQTIPSLALLALLFVAIGKIGALPVIISLVLYALLPIARGTLTGLETTPQHLAQAAAGLGMTPWQRLRYVRLPLAMPHIISGIRVATNINIGIATIATFVGGGALGVFISRGLSNAEPELILLGAIPAALLALVVDAMIANLQRCFFRRRAQKVFPWDRFVAILLPLLLIAFALWAGGALGTKNDETTITIGSKNFTEQLILGEIIAQSIEADSDIMVNRQFGMQGTLLLHNALLRGEIDLYPEYTGTAAISILKKMKSHDSKKLFDEVQRRYAKKYQLAILPPLGFNNSYVFAMKKDRAKQLNITNLSGLITKAPELKAAFDYEFAEREDGYKKLKAEHGLRFENVIDMHAHLMVEALQTGEVDVISAYTTDGRIKAYDLVVIEDDLHFFPPYDAFIAVRQDTLKAHPKIDSALQSLSAKLTDATMRELNYQVDFHKRAAADVARDWLSGAKPSQDHNADVQ